MARQLASKSRLTFRDATASCARLVAPTAQAAPTHAGAPPEQLRSLASPQELASGRPKVEDVPLAPSRQDTLFLKMREEVLRDVVYDEDGKPQVRKEEEAHA